MTNNLYFGDSFHVLREHIADEDEVRSQERFRRQTRAKPEKPA